MEKKLGPSGWILPPAVATKEVLDDLNLLDRVKKNFAALYADARMRTDFMESGSIDIDQAFKQRDAAKEEAADLRTQFNQMKRERDNALAKLEGLQQKVDEAQARVRELERENSELNTLFMEKKILDVAEGKTLKEAIR